MDGDVRGEKLEEIPVDLIDPSPTNPRKRFDEKKLQELADDLEAHGLIEPVRARPMGDRYELVVGERRLRAMKLTSRGTIAAIVRGYTNREVCEIQVSENGQREDAARRTP